MKMYIHVHCTFTSWKHKDIVHFSLYKGSGSLGSYSLIFIVEDDDATWFVFLSRLNIKGNLHKLSSISTLSVFARFPFLSHSHSPSLSLCPLLFLLPPSHHTLPLATFSPARRIHSPESLWWSSCKTSRAYLLDNSRLHMYMYMYTHVIHVHVHVKKQYTFMCTLCWVINVIAAYQFLCDIVHNHPCF